MKIKTIVNLLFFFTAVLPKTLLAQEAVTSIAYSDNNTRFTIISDGMVRMEYSSDGKFIDAPSFIAVNRKYPKTDYQIKKRRNSLEIITKKMKIYYKLKSGKFTADNLAILSTDKSCPFIWKLGMKQTENLKGTSRTLDGMDGDTLTIYQVDNYHKGDTLKLEDGLLAKDGWTFIDDSKGFLFDNDDEWNWVQKRPEGDRQDFYFMAYGRDYKKALKDFTLLSGKMPLLPRYAFGYWWSRYWAYSDKELRNLADKFQTYGIPLDVMVIDMDWHYTEKGKGGWTGWTWNKSLFPDHKKLLRHLKSRGLKITLNLHPADGVAPYEEKYVSIASDLGIDSSSAKNIPWVSSDKRFIKSMFKNILTPYEEDGVDFWWLDWQQYKYDAKIANLSNTWWLNYTFFSHAEKFGSSRPLLYHRWGGLGNHRYQAGFSGDAVISWKSLDYQPYFNSTSSNVLYGYWSHDIGGHIGKSIDPEMYIRWMQFGAFSPIMRTHSQKGSNMNKEPWAFSEKYCSILRQIIKQRYRFVPYIYTMARKGYDEGISLCRPMYYDYPDTDEAYSFRNEYMFGDDILIFPITKPGKEGYTEVDLWLPDGEWYELHSGQLLEGNKIITRSFALDEYPVYIKAGTILPMYTDDVMNLNDCNERIVATVFPGKAGNSNFILYEDNGNDKNYAAEYASTRISLNRNASMDEIIIGTRKGKFDGMETSRKLSVKILSALYPEKVTINGKPAEFRYIGEELAIYINIPYEKSEMEQIVRIQYSNSHADLKGLYGKIRRIYKEIESLKLRNAKICLKEKLGYLGSFAEAVSYDPKNLQSLVEKFWIIYYDLPNVLKEQGLKKEEIDLFLRNIGWYHDNTNR